MPSGAVSGQSPQLTGGGHSRVTAFLTPRERGGENVHNVTNCGANVGLCSAEAIC